MIMRWVFALFLVATGIYLLKGRSASHLAVRRILFFLFVVSGITSILFANTWTNLSQFLGVENGTALLTYFVTFSFIGYVISNFRWRREIENRLVILTRELTLKNVRQNFDHEENITN